MVLSTTTAAARLADQNDEPLNYSKDQAANLNPQLRQLNLQLAVRTVGELASDPAAALVLAGTVGLLFRRKFAAATFLAAGLLLQRALARRQAPQRPTSAPDRQRKEIELERYALKAQRGDYGKLEVIPFR